MKISKCLSKLVLSVGIFLFTIQASAQTRTVGAFMVDETELYAMTKQMSQFFSRFNNEEDQFGKKYHYNSSEYRNNEKRKQLLPLLFDKENLRTSSALKDFFIDDLTTPKATNFMEFLGGRWYSEVSATFEFQGKTVNIIMILMIEKERLGSKWVLTNVYFPTFNRMFPAGEIAEREKHFLHPMSHELDFMNIHKAFRQPEVIDYYASNNFRPDYLSLFFYEVKLGRLKFVKIDELKFHIFQINNWYFEVSWFNRKGNNSGWLISNLMYVTEQEKESLLKFYEP
ncbi:MAG: hypothetical protein KG029_07085 [Bacteroidetes bacterium]|jgi:hypothetical protein|nr:hypothetical protein [Bacteroidota bacterium]